MKSFIPLIGAVLIAASSASAAVVDLTDNTFTSVDYVDFVQGPLGPIEEFVETVDGVAFTFSAKSVSGQFRNVGTWGNGMFGGGPHALSFGGGGGNTATFTLSASADVTLNAFVGFAQQFNTGAIFDVAGAGVSSTGNAFSTAAFLASGTPVADSFVGGPLSLMAGQVYTFTTTNSGVATQSHLTGLDFTTVQQPPAVPLPAGLPLLLAGLGGLAWMRRRQG
ncbi:VPLPA-CTERM sorting domain-containing protein [uncultured Tateyamaria sp.]|uniref:VPLPA-CTERM sorting domain-containing protein n=1 Tax=uncultured Tateyamaria sp. TaxID=455651 RepID=UPI0026212836|nr:VPLPA-CTERM sorting domain-containing protein [uncultured Tateyamaria sp.]